jgi:hypothetical protein
MRGITHKAALFESVDCAEIRKETGVTDIVQAEEALRAIQRYHYFTAREAYELIGMKSADNGLVGDAPAVSVRPALGNHCADRGAGPNQT